MTYITEFCPTTWRNIPWLYALSLHGSRSCCSFRLASSAPEAGRRCILRLGKATPPWSSSWSLRGPRCTRSTTPAVAPEGFSSRFGSGSDEVTEGVRTLADLLFMIYHDLSTFCPMQQPRFPRRILGARGHTALHRAALIGHAAVVEQLISAGATVDAASKNGRGPGRVSGSFWEWLWRGDGRGSYWRWKGFVTLAADFCAFALGYWVVLAVKRSTFVLGWASWNSGVRNDETYPNMGDMSGRHVVANVHWIWNFWSLWAGSHICPLKNLKRLITVVWHELWAETSCQKRRQVGGM